MPLRPLPLGPLPLDALWQRLSPLLQQLLALLARLRLPLPGWLRSVGWRVLLAGVLLGGIVHVCATLATPSLSSGHAYQLLHEKLPLNRMLVLPPQAPGRQLLPYLPPDMLYAMCRYDLSNGPVAVTAVVADAGWALSLHTPHGANFYVLPGQPLRRTEVSLLLVPSGPDPSPGPRRDGQTDTPITSPTLQGLVVLRGPLRGLAWAAEAEATLRRASCTTARR